jgi:uncharacterized lipoprotein NlpE involved in copper resistance
MGDRIQFATRRGTTVVPADRLWVLAERMGNLESARTAREKIEAAIDTGVPVELTLEEKSVTLGVMQLWMKELGVGDMGNALNEVRRELQVDLGARERPEPAPRGWA